MEINPTTPQFSPKPEQNAPKEPSKALKIGVLIALIILLIVGIVLPIKLVPNAFSSFSDTVSSWFTSSKTTLSTSPSAIESGSPFTLSWTGTHKDTGSYSISYTCASGVTIQATIGQSLVAIPCGDAFYFSSPQNSLILNPVSTMQRYTDVELSLGYLESGSSTPTVLGTTLISIENANATGMGSTTATSTTTSTNTAPTTTATSSSTTTYPTTTTKPTQPVTTSKPAPVSVIHTHRVSNPNGTTDLVVKIQATGYMNDNAVFVPASTISSSMRAAFKFIITNVGDKTSGSVSFTATLPTVSHPTYTAFNLPSIAPGDSLVYVLGFDNITPASSSQVSVTVTAAGDTNSANNTSSATINQY